MDVDGPQHMLKHRFRKASWVALSAGLVGSLSLQATQGVVVQPTRDWPTPVWSRALGEGRAGIIAEDNRVYTAYRQPRWPDMETIASMNAETGRTVWEYIVRTPPRLSDGGLGPGPESTPLSLGDHIYARGSRGYVVAIDKRSGRAAWSHDLVAKHNASPDGLEGDFSPLAYAGSLIVAIGGDAEAIAAFDLKAGLLLWKAGLVGQVRAKPLLMKVGDQTQVVVAGDKGLAAVDPTSGRVLWRHDVAVGQRRVTLVALPRDVLVVASPDFGSRALDLITADGNTRVMTKWVNPAVVVSDDTIANSDYAFGITADARLAEIDVATGRHTLIEPVVRRPRVTASAGRLVFLAEDGSAALVEASRRNLTVLVRGIVPLNASARPTLQGTRLYIRDTKTIAAFELGPR